MPLIQIKSRWNDSLVLYECEAEGVKEAVEKASLYGANLDRANLYGANLDGANLDRANLDGANLYGASLSGASLYRANLDRANLDRANLYGANLDGASLDGASLYRANLDGASLSGANLDGASLYRAKNVTIEMLRASKLGPIRGDFYDVLLSSPAEIPALREALISGRIDGSCYEGECSCLVGTIAAARHVSPFDMEGLRPDSGRPAERWFLAINKGDTPETNPFAALALEWIDRLTAIIGAVPAVTI